MSAASAQPCVACKASSSKYKCPTCAQPTCSLACSKQHKSVAHSITSQGQQDERRVEGDAPETQTTTTTTTTTMTRGLPSLRLDRDETIEAPASHRFKHVDQYVPMNRYSEANLLEDVEYLHFIGRSVSAIGRDIVKKGWLRAAQRQKEQEEARKAAAAGVADGSKRHAEQGRAPNPQGRKRSLAEPRLTGEERNRQQYEMWIRRLRLPVLLLPDGMSARKENQTRFKANTRQLHCTVQFAFPCAADGKDHRARRALVHHVPWDRSLMRTALLEIGKRIRSDGAHDPTSAWHALVGRRLSLRPEELAERMEEVEKHIAVVVPVHLDRLRNETSAKFLEWWQRQVQNGLVKADGLQLDEEKRLALQQARQSDWAPIEGLPSDSGAQHIRPEDGLKDLSEHAANRQADEPLSNVGLIQTALLHRLQARRDAQEKADDRDEQFAQEQHITKGAAAAPVRSVVVLKGLDMTIEQLYRSLPKGMAIVEYPHIELWDRQELSKMLRDGKIREERLSLENQTTSANIESASAIEGKRKHVEFTGDEATKKMRTHSPAKAESSTSALTGLAAYDSSDEESQESDAEADDVAGNDYGSLADIARSFGMAPSTVEKAIEEELNRSL